MDVQKRRAWNEKKEVKCPPCLSIPPSLSQVWNLTNSSTEMLKYLKPQPNVSISHHFLFLSNKDNLESIVVEFLFS